jgi:ribosomal protein S12 methylthiotransferase accessory factor
MELTATCPRYKYHFHVEVIDEDRVYLVSEAGHQILKGRLFALLAPHIDGTSTVGEIASRLDGQLSPLDVRHGLAQMERLGVIVDSNQAGPEHFPAFRDLLGADPEEYQARLSQTSVTVTALGSVSADQMADKLQALNLRVSDDGDLLVVLVDDYLCGDLDEVSRNAHSQKRPWLIARPVGVVAWLGPLFDPQHSGCWTCLSERIRRNRVLETWMREHKGVETPLPVPSQMLPTTLDAALNLTATAVYHWVTTGRNEQLVNRLITFDQVSLRADTHVLVANASCPVCGHLNGQENQPHPIKLSSCKKIISADGGYRSVFPEQTLKAVRHHVSPITGIVRELRPHRGSGELVHVWIAGPNVARPDQLQRRGLRNKTAGKGMGDAQASAGAICEALERFSGILRETDYRRVASLSELGPEAIHPNDCMLFSQQQYQERERWNTCGDPFAWVPQPFSKEQELEWSPVWSLTEETFKYLPTAYCYFDYPQTDDDSCRVDSNGNAAGNTLEEAILQGFMELVERDAVAIWWYNCCHRPAVDLESFGVPYFMSLQEYYQSLGRPLWVLDVTSDLGIPVFVAFSGDVNGEGPPMLLGFGAHLDATVAVSRALTEMNQLLANLHGGGKVEVFIGRPEPSFLIPDRDQAARRLEDFEPWQSDDLKTDVEHCVELAAGQGVETLVLDLSRPEVELRAVKMFAPGLRLFTPRFASGRLYQVPAQLGWCTEPLTEQQLNPAHLRM